MHLVRFFIVCFLEYNLKTGQNFVLSFNWPHSEYVKIPLTFFPPTLAIRTINYTGISVEAIPNSKMKEIATGGILGDEKFQFYRGRFYWESCNNETSLKIRFIFYNAKYASFQDASKQSDGIIQIYDPVETNGCIDNPAFSAFEEIFTKCIKKPGDYALINSLLSYQWYDHFSYNSVYKSYQESFYDEETGETASRSLVIECPKSGKNFISAKQYTDTFGSLVDCNGQIVENPASQLRDDLSSVVESKGICIVPV